MGMVTSTPSLSRRPSATIRQTEADPDSLPFGSIWMSRLWRKYVNVCQRDDEVASSGRTCRKRLARVLLAQRELQ